VNFHLKVQDTYIQLALVVVLVFHRELVVPIDYHG
jgi:hypothetical protein